MPFLAQYQAGIADSGTRKIAYNIATIRPSIKTAITVFFKERKKEITFISRHGWFVMLRGMHSAHSVACTVGGFPSKSVQVKTQEKGHKKINYLKHV